MSDLLIRDVRLTDAERDAPGGLLVRGGRIAAHLPADLTPGEARALAARHDAELVHGGGLRLIPGGVDPHVHFALPVAGTVTVDDFASGSRAALAGGTTTFLDFVTPAPGASLVAAVEARLREASASACDYSLHMTVTRWTDATAAELRRGREEFGLTSVKLYLAYLETIGLDDDALRRAMAAAADLDLTVLLHCEDGRRVSARQRELLAAGRTGPDAHPDSRPAEYEEASVRHALDVAAATGARIYVVHASTAGAVEAVARARDAGRVALIETCPQYLLLDDSRYRGDPALAAACVMSPPLRPPAHGAALRRAVRDGVIDAVGTDHCSFTLAQKTAAPDFTGIPGGAAGVQHRLGLLAAAVPELAPRDWVRLTSAAPARIFGLAGKGTLDVGADADLVLWDEKALPVLDGATDAHRCDHGIFDGIAAHGAPRRVWRRGLPADATPGRFLKRA